MSVHDRDESLDETIEMPGPGENFQCHPYSPERFAAMNRWWLSLPWIVGCSACGAPVELVIGSCVPFRERLCPCCRAQLTERAS